MVEQLLAALRGLAAEDLCPLPAPDLLARTAGLVAARNMLDAELARTVRRGELTQPPEHDGQRGMAPWLRGHARLSAPAAARVVRAGRTLEQLPAVAARCAAGAITADQVKALAPVVDPARRAAAAAQGVDFGAVDELLADVAATRPHTELARVVAHYLARLDPDGPEPDPTEGRKLSIAKHADGSTTGRFDLDPVGSEKVQTALEAIVQANRPAGDTRTRAQQLADALVQLADNALAAGTLPFLRTVKPHLLITLPGGDLTDPAPGPATADMGFGATISAATARAAGCDATITRLVLDPDGVPLDLGRTVRLVPPQLRRAVEARDKGCGVVECAERRLPCPHLLVRGSSFAVLGPRRRHVAGKFGAALRTPPHPGPRRLPHRTTTRRPLAHLAPRRHRDPRPPSRKRRPTHNPRRLSLARLPGDLARMELLPDFQGQGLGTGLLHQLIASAEAAGARAVELDVLDGNERARRLYERCGFRVVSLQPPKCRMGLTLGASA